MRTSTFIIAAIAAGTMTVVSHARDADSPRDAASTAVQAESSENASGGSLGDLLKKIIRGGQKPASERTAAGIDGTVTGAIRAPVKQDDAGPSKGTRPYHAIISRYAAEHGVPVALAHAIVAVESNYRPSARGRAGEIGLMQIKYSTARGIGYRGSAKGLYDPETNIKWGMRYLAKAYQLGGGSTCGAILRYNAGHGAKRMNPISSAYCAKVKRMLAGG